MRLEPNCFPPSFLPPNQQEAFCCRQRIPPVAKMLRLVPREQHPRCQGTEPGRLSPSCSRSRSPGGAVPPLALTPSFSPSRSWSGPWSRTARTRSPPLCTPPLPTRARRWAPAAPARPPRRRPGELQPLAAARGNAGGAAGHEPPVREGSGVSLLGLDETKPRGMNEARSWLNNIREAPRCEQLRGPESSWSEWNGKNQLLGAGSA